MTVTKPDFAFSLLWALDAKRLIGKRVAKQMKKLGYTDESLAQAAEVTTKTIWRLRNGRSSPRTSTAVKVAAALQMSVEDLQPPKTPDDDPLLHEQLREVLQRLTHIERVLEPDETSQDPSSNAPVKPASKSN